MFSLALETSGRVGSVALVRDGLVIDEREYPHGLKHATALVPLLDQLCRDHKIGPNDLRELYVSIGPGSFTGLRVGVTLVKSLAYVSGAKIVAVPSLRVLVENVDAQAGDHAIVALDAKRGQVFCGIFQRTEKSWRETSAPSLQRLHDVTARTPRPLHVIGELTGTDLANLSSDPTVVLTSNNVARAAVVAQLGIQLARDGKLVEPFALTPLYVRLPEAEEKRLIAEGKLPAAM